jgi:MFS family permease
VNNHATLAVIGGLYTTLFAGALLAQVLLGRFTDRWGQHRALVVAFLVFSTGMAASTFSRWLPLTFGLVFLAGIGYGTANLCGNVLIGRVFKENRVTAVNWVNVFYGIGGGDRSFAGQRLAVPLERWRARFLDRFDSDDPRGCHYDLPSI